MAAFSEDLVVYLVHLDPRPCVEIELILHCSKQRYRHLGTDTLTIDVKLVRIKWNSQMFKNLDLSYKVPQMTYLTVVVN